MTVADVRDYAQIVFVIIAFISAIVAAYVGIGQLRASNRYELLKLLESPDVRDARQLLYVKLRRNQPPVKWWENDDELDKAAATVCASFDIVALMARWRNRRFFCKEWGSSIIWAYEVLEEYIKSRHPGAYKNYRKLYTESLR
jgi:hypothetical protein